jgi:hypothetical protein
MTPTMQILRRAPGQTPRLATLPFLCLLILLGLPAAPAGPALAANGPPPGAPVSPADPDARLRATVAAIEQAFILCDPSLLRSVLPRRMKIYVSTVSLGIDPAYYGPDQSLVLMERVCDGRTTLRFVPTAAPRQPQVDADTTFTAQWISRAFDGAEEEVRLVFVLAPEDSAWQIREVRQLK